MVSLSFIPQVLRNRMIIIIILNRLVLQLDAKNLINTALYIADFDLSMQTA